MAVLDVRMAQACAQHHGVRSFAALAQLAEAADVHEAARLRHAQTQQREQRLAARDERIKRLEGEGPQPIAAYAKDDIDARGFQTTGDFLQSLSFNSGTTNSIGV